MSSKTTGKILITGSSGTIGNRLCETFELAGKNYLGIDYRKNIWNEKTHSKTKYLDLRKAKELDEINDKIEMIIHLGANARVFNLVNNPSLAKDNFITTYNICEFARKNNIKKIIFASSREVYGNSDKIIYDENESFVKHCESNYTATKIAGEALLHSYYQCYGINFIILRFSNVFGRYDYSDRVIPLFILKALKNKDITIFGRDKILDFTYVDDTIMGINRAFDCFEKAKNEIYNIATGKGYSIEDVTKMIINNTNSKSTISFAENRKGEVCKYIANINKARSVLGYEPQFSIDQSIQKTIEWYKPRVNEYSKFLIDSKSELI
tara:strand:+ start:327 stop:1298 length:972 start_codon:yes stop_codon:yes gene_type:complete